MNCSVLMLWAIYFTFGIAYLLMTSVEAGVSTLQVWLYYPWQRRDIRHANEELENVSP